VTVPVGSPDMSHGYAPQEPMSRPTEHRLPRPTRRLSPLRRVRVGQGGAVARRQGASEARCSSREMHPVGRRATRSGSTAGIDSAASFTSTARPREPDRVYAPHTPRILTPGWPGPRAPDSPRSSRSRAPSGATATASSSASQRPARGPQLEDPPHQPPQLRLPQRRGADRPRLPLLRQRRHRPPSMNFTPKSTGAPLDRCRLAGTDRVGGSPRFRVSLPRSGMFGSR
jgi:hypothetical protein